MTSHYDSMIAKVIVWDETRLRAIKKLKQTLSESLVLGVHTNIPFVKEMISHPEFIDGSLTTQFIGKHFPDGLAPRERSAIELEFEKQALPGASAPNVAGETASASALWIGDRPWSNV